MVYHSTMVYGSKVLRGIPWYIVCRLLYVAILRLRRTNISVHMREVIAKYPRDRKDFSSFYQRGVGEFDLKGDLQSPKL